MADTGTSGDPLRTLYDYHRWANRRLFDVAAALGEAACAREVGAQFSFPTLTRMFVHLYGADAIWLARWKGTSPASTPGASIATLGELRARWDALEAEQRAFVESLAPGDRARIVQWTSTEGQPFRAPLEALLHHVPAHGVHHRSEIATMLTMVSGSPPDTGLLTYHLVKTGQR
jgi:uncharacterized damage-inducible protein DinB